MQHIESSVRPGACLPCLSVCLVCLLCLSHLTDITRMSRIAVGATATAVANHVIPTSARHSRTCARRRSNEPPQHSTAHECLSYHRLILHHQSIYSPLQLYYIHFLHGCFIQDATTQAHAAPKQHERNVRIIHPPKQVWPFCAITTPQKNFVVQRQSDIYLHSIVRCCLLKKK